MTLLLFLLDLFILEVIQLFRNSTASFAVDAFMNVRIFRQEDLSEQRWRVKLVKYKKFAIAWCTMNGLIFNFSLLSPQNTAPAVWELQTGGASHRGGDAASADPAEGRRAHLWYLPQDQVCRRLRPPLLLLPDQILRSLWRAGLSALQQCEKPDLWPPPFLFLPLTLISFLL